MQLRSHPLPIILAAAILSAGVNAGAQEFRVEVVEASTGKPIVGANVALLDSAGAIPLGGDFSDQGGRTYLRAPSRGPDRIRVEKVRFGPWVLVQLQPGQRPTYSPVGMA